MGDLTQETLDFLRHKLFKTTTFKKNQYFNYLKLFYLNEIKNVIKFQSLSFL